MKCSNCDSSVSTNQKFCGECGDRIIQPDYTNTYGTWHVKSNDGWGGNEKDLGTHTGHVDDIARMFINMGNILEFSIEGGIVRPPLKEINIRFDSKSKIEDMTPEQRAIWFQKIFKNRPVKIGVCGYSSAITIKY